MDSKVGDSYIDLTKTKQKSVKEKIFILLTFLLILLCPPSIAFCFKVVKQYKRAVVLRFGRLRSDSPAGPGIIWVLPCTDSVTLIDLRTQSFNLLPQEILTKDSVTVTVDAVVYCHVTEPLRCLLNVHSYKRSTQLLAIAILRNILGQYTLTDLLTNRESISHAVRKEIDKGTNEWGVEVERVEMKDVVLPFDLQKAMAAEAEGTRIAKAKIIEAEGEIRAAENLRDASKILIDKPQTLLKLIDKIDVSYHNKEYANVYKKNKNFINKSFTNMESTKKESANRSQPKDIQNVTQPNTNITIKDLDTTATRSKYSSNPHLQNENGKGSLIEKVVVLLSILLAILTFPLSLLLIFVVIRQFERAVILRNGKVYKDRVFGPGLIFYLPCVDSVKFVDLRTFCYAVPPQEALTKDSLTVAVDAIVFYKIVDPVLAIISVTDYKASTHFLAATTLRNALGTRKLTEILANRPVVSQQVFQFMKNITNDWGINVVRVDIKDIRLPLQLQKAMAAEAESTRLANAKIIVAKAEIESTKSLRLATDILMDNPMCMQLRYLQSLQSIASEKTHTIVFPFSPDLVKKIFSK